jgi:Zn-dependent M28 family amino/carboxypeptidase
MLEAARLIQVLGLKPRRTIRVALWSGEEEGLLGSLAYVKRHFGTFENQKPEFEKLDCYFNVDSGTGRIRGGSAFGRRKQRRVAASASSVQEWGVGGINVTSSRNTGGT